MEFREKLRFMRDLRKMTQDELAQAAGLHRVTIAEMESNGSDCRMSTLERLAAALKCEPGDLIGDSKR